MVRAGKNINIYVDCAYHNDSSWRSARAYAFLTQLTQRNAVRRTHGGVVTGSSARRYMRARESINSRLYALRSFEGAKAREIERKMGRATGWLAGEGERKKGATRVGRDNE